MERAMKRILPNSDFYLRTLYETQEKEKKYKWSLMKTKELFSSKKNYYFFTTGCIYTYMLYISITWI